MKALIKTLSERFLLAAVAGGVIALFHYYGGFALQASLLLGIGFTIVGLWLYLLRAAALFKPYRLIIGVNYKAICEALQLAPSDTVPCESFTLTAISPALYARSDARSYSTTLDLYAPLPTAAPAWRPSFGGMDDRPTVFIRPSRGGYKIGVHVEAAWWEDQVKSLEPALQQQTLAYDGTITLGFLPAGYIPDHVQRWHEAVSLFYPFDRKQRQWNATLQSHGWTVRDDEPGDIEHRFIVLRYLPL